MAGGVGFGYAGISAAEEDLYRVAQTEKTYGEIAMQPAEALRKAAEARKSTAEAGKLEMEAAQTRQMMELAAQQGPSTPTEGASAADIAYANLYQRARNAHAVGKHELGSKLDVAATTVKRNESAAISSQATARLREIQGNIQASNELARHINSDTVRDQGALDIKWKELGLQGPPPTYTPELVRGIQRAALSEHERFQSEHQRLTRDETKRMNNARIQEIVDRRPLTAARVKEAEANTERLTREGAAGPRIKPEQLREATNLIGSRYDGVEKEEGAVLGAELIRTARRKVEANPALRYEQALAQALGEAEGAGVFTPFQKRQPGAPKPGTVTPPSNQQVDMARQLLSAEIPELKDTKDKDAASRSVAARAKVLQRTREPDWDAALQLALAEEIEGGNLPVGRNMIGLLRRTYKSGASAEKARVLPEDLTKVRKDHFYTDDKGVTRKFLGGNPMDRTSWSE